MRETRTSGSEGGGGDASPYPYQLAAALDCRVKPGNDKGGGWHEGGDSESRFAEKAPTIHEAFPCHARA